MATISYNCTKDASMYEQGNSWSGWDDHHPVGTNSNGNTWRSVIYFPISFSGMTSITSATLTLYGHKVAFVSHVFSNETRSIYAERVTSDWGEGTDRGENVWSGNETWDWGNRSGSRTSTGQATRSFSGGITHQTEYTMDVTDIVRSWAPAAAGGSGTANYGIMLRATTEATGSIGVEFYARHVSAYRPTITIVYNSNTAPTVPTGLSPTGGVVVQTLAPTFVAQFNDVNAGDSIKQYQINVSTDNTFASVTHWNVTGTPASAGTTSVSRAYGGTALTGGTTYYWRIRMSDQAGAWSPYTAAQSFIPNTNPPTPTGLSPATASTVSTLTPTFSGTSDDNDIGDQLAYAQVIVYSDASGTVKTWDSGEFAASGSTFSKAYGTGGTLTSALVVATTYYWKSRVRDTRGGYSAWTSLQTFTTYAAGVPTGMTPTNAKVNTLTPTLAATAAQTQNAYQIIVYNATTGAQHFDTGTVASSGTAISYVYAGTALAWGTKYRWKVRSRTSSGSIWSAYSPNETGSTFWTNAAPTATLTSPASASVLTTLTPAFVTVFSDADKSNGFNDAPTSYSVEVSRVSDSVVMHTLVKASGLVSGSNSVTRAAEGTALSYNVQYRWRAKYTDNSGAANAAGAYSAYSTFTPSQVPTVTSLAIQAADLTAGEINKPTATLTYTFTGSGGKSQAHRRVRVLDSVDNSELFDSGYVASSAASYTFAAGLIRQNTPYGYIFEVRVRDTDGLYSSAPITSAYTATWAPPAALTDISATGDDTRGFVSVSWGLSVEADFLHYTIYRRATNDPTGEFRLVATITDKSQFRYNDYYTGFATEYQYMVTQWKTMAGDSPLESLPSDIVTTSIAADDWWVVVPGASGFSSDPSPLSFSMVVTDEDHTQPYQEEIFEPFGRNRKVVVRSGLLGREGDLRVIFEAHERAEKLAKLEAILASSTTVILKNPFGDFHTVALGAPKRSYVNGGHLTFTMSYIEVD